MKKKLILFCAVMSFIAGCAINTMKPYRSESGIPKKTTSTFTEFDLIKGNEDYWAVRDYALFYCVDNRSNDYLLLAPGDPHYQGRLTFDRCELYNSVPLNLNDIENLMDRLKFAASTWDTELPVEKAYSVDFYITLEQNIDSLSEHVEQIKPSFAFRYQNCVNNRLAVFKFKNRMEWEINDVNYIIDLIDLLKEGKNRITHKEPEMKKKS